MQYAERRGTATKRHSPKSKAQRSTTTRQARQEIDEPPEELDELDEWDETEEFAPAPLRTPFQVLPISGAPGSRPAVSPTTARNQPGPGTAEVERKAREETQRLQDLKSHGMGCIPYDLPAAWRAKVIEELESYVTSERLPAWVSSVEQYGLVRGRVEVTVKAYRQEVEAENQRKRTEAARREAEEARKRTEAKAKAEAERRVDEVIAHGKRYAEQELREFEVFDRWEIRMEVEKALREEVSADWLEADVEELVDEVLDEFDHE